MILDTTFVIDLFRNNEAAAEKAKELDKRREAVFVTAVTVFELWQGADARQEDMKEKLSQFVETFGMLQLGAESAKKGGEIHAELESRGVGIDPEDSMIAGIAAHAGQTVLTRDEHYSRIKGLRVESY